MLTSESAYSPYDHGRFGETGAPEFFIALAKTAGEETNENHAHPIWLRSIPNHGPFLQNDRQTPGIFINFLPVFSAAPPTPPIRLSQAAVFTDEPLSQCCSRPADVWIEQPRSKLGSWEMGDSLRQLAYFIKYTTSK